jgi:hypothetical protein
MILPSGRWTRTRVHVSSMTSSPNVRRYQGWDPDTVEDAEKRMALYHIFEKYNGITRND